MSFSAERFEAQMAMDRASRNARQRREQNEHMKRWRDMDAAQVAKFIRAELTERGYGPVFDALGGGVSADPR